MALRAGYFGLKRKLIDKVESMLDISTIGDGLSLVSGTLSAAIKSIGDGLTLSEAGVLSANGGGVDYSETEQNTGLKWIDAKDVYSKTVTVTSPTTNDVLVADVVDTFIGATGTCTLSNSEIYPAPVAFSTYKCLPYVGTTDTHDIIIDVSGVSAATLTLYYTKIDTNAKKKGGKK